MLNDFQVYHVHSTLAMHTYAAALLRCKVQHEYDAKQGPSSVDRSGTLLLNSKALESLLRMAKGTNTDCS